MSKRLTQEECLKRFKEVHGDKYDYSKVVFNNVDEKVCIICKEHGEFWQTPYKHINRKQGCPYCSKNVKFSKEEFVKESLKTHILKYDYSKVNYINAQKDVEIVCPIHGSFWQNANLHRRGANCPKCALEQGAEKRRKTIEEFIKEAKEVHSDKYNYSLVDYKNYETKIKIICPIHGIFEQDTEHHLAGNGCPICKESKGEKKIRSYFQINNIKFIPQKRFKNCRGKLPLPFDFYIPSKKLLIEYNGEQHYKPIDFFGGYKKFLKQKHNDWLKRKYAKDNKISLLTISYKDYKVIEEILEEQIGANKN